jgi:transposase-like protein
VTEKRDYRRFSSEEKYKAVKEKLTTDMSVSEICKKYDISATLFYHWQEKFLEGARTGMAPKRTSDKGELKQRELEKKNKEIERMREVIAEITSENVAFKKKSLE